MHIYGHIYMHTCRYRAMAEEAAQHEAQQRLAVEEARMEGCVCMFACIHVHACMHACTCMYACMHEAQRLLAV